MCVSPRAQEYTNEVFSNDGGMTEGASTRQSSPEVTTINSGKKRSHWRAPERKQKQANSVEGLSLGRREWHWWVSGRFPALGLRAGHRWSHAGRAATALAENLRSCWTHFFRPPLPFALWPLMRLSSFAFRETQHFWFLSFLSNLSSRTSYSFPLLCLPFKY